jgi:hypothetical protein
MITHINLENADNQFTVINNFFKKEYKITYNKKLSGKVRLYVSERNAIKNLKGIVSLYKRELQ